MVFGSKPEGQHIKVLLTEARAFVTGWDYYRRTSPLTNAIEVRLVEKGKKPRGAGWKKTTEAFYQKHHRAYMAR